MLVAGIVAEFNPFHLGHAALISAARRAGATHVAVVMSGNYVQRGEPAILSKWARTKQALACGADLVAELPLPWAASGAEKFALGGLTLLHALGAGMLCFGSECGDAKALGRAAQALSSPSLHGAMKDELSRGGTFAKARQNAVKRLFGEQTAQILTQPNNILAVEYLRAMHRLNADMVPFTIRRAGAAHDAAEPESGIASASYIRSLVREGGDFTPLMPEPAARVLREEIGAGRAPVLLQYAERAVLARLRGMRRSDFSALPDISEGLEHRVRAAVRRAVTLDGLYDLIKTKRYPHARIRRIVLSAFLGLTAAAGEGLPPYLRVLGLNPRGAEILHAAKPGIKLPVLTRACDTISLDKHAEDVLELECAGTDLYALCFPSAAPCGLDLTAGMVSAPLPD